MCDSATARVSVARLKIDSISAQACQWTQARDCADRLSTAIAELVAPLTPIVTRLKAGAFHHP